IFKRSKSNTSGTTSISAKRQTIKGQSSLVEFFKSNPPGNETETINRATEGRDQCSSFYSNVQADQLSGNPATPSISGLSDPEICSNRMGNYAVETYEGETFLKPFQVQDQKDFVDPILPKESWSKLFSKRVVPRCEHNEPCISFSTKKPGINCGRSFYMCPRPLGPSGQKEKNTPWRCGTFIWSSDWAGER